MHDFCFTPLYCVVLAVGAVLGFLKGSTVSLAVGGGTAAIAGIASYVSLQKWKSKHKKCTSSVVVSAVLASAVAFKMSDKFLKDPAGHITQGILFISSAIMVLYYVWNLLLFRPKAATAHKVK